MGKIIASYIIKVHVHEDESTDEAPKIPDNQDVTDAIVDGVKEFLGHEATVSQIDRVDE